MPYPRGEVKESPQHRSYGEAYRLPSIICLFLLLVFFTRGIAVGQNKQSQVPRPDVAAKYLRALQQHDFKAVIESSASYQAEVDKIKASNPQVLWPNLIGQYIRRED